MFPWGFVTPQEHQFQARSPPIYLSLHTPGRELGSQQVLDEELLLVLEPQAWSNQIQGAVGTAGRAQESGRSGEQEGNASPGLCAWGWEALTPRAGCQDQ